jgi:hypothetical protein
VGLGIRVRKITIICSAHRESGVCNSGELLRILRAIDPEAVFEEVCPSDYEAYNIRTLEGRAITRYREFKVLERVPVDRYNLPQDLYVAIEKVLDHVEEISHEYSVLREQSDNSAHLQGFSYLNSVAFETVRTKLTEIEDRTISEACDQGLTRGLEMWRDVIQRRETAMVGNIYEYCREHIFDTGVFLVGAAHKSGILKAIEKHASSEADLVSWKLYQG